MRLGRLTIAFVLAAGLLAPGAAAVSAATTMPTDKIATTKAYVDRMGGISLAGTVTCAGTAQLVRDHQVVVWDETAQAWVPIPFEPGDEIEILTNPDTYEVIQPVGRKTTIRASHHSTRMHPCYSDVGGTPAPTATWPWATDMMAYDGSDGRLFDYPVAGKFSAGNVVVTMWPAHMDITILRDGVALSTWWLDDAWWPDHAVSTVRAVKIR